MGLNARKGRFAALTNVRSKAPAPGALLPRKNVTAKLLTDEALHPSTYPSVRLQPPHSPVAKW